MCIYTYIYIFRHIVISFLNIMLQVLIVCGLLFTKCLFCPRYVTPLLSLLLWSADPVLFSSIITEQVAITWGEIHLAALSELGKVQNTMEQPWFLGIQEGIDMVFQIRKILHLYL